MKHLFLFIIMLQLIAIKNPLAATKTDSLKYPATRLLECTHVGVPLVLGGIIEIEQNKKFRQLRNSYIPKFHSEIDNYTQYLPAGVMFGMKACGVQSRSGWGEMLTADAFSIALMAISVNGVKNTAKLMRPDGSSHNSFPSGHSATAFMTATMLNKEYGHLSPWVGMLAYTNATATGLMRMANNRHWMSDIMAGAGFGIMATEFGYWFSDMIFKKEKTRSELVDLWHNYEPSKPSFIGTYVGFQFPLFKYRPNLEKSFSTSTGSVAGLEGAWYWNTHWGMGGRLSASSVYYRYGDDDAVSGTLDISTIQIGVYSNYNIYKYWYFSPKILTGINHFPKIVNEQFGASSRSGACLTAGISSGIMASPYLDVNFFADWNLYTPHCKKITEAIHSITLGARFAYRFNL
ncbi:MAG: phosphatase PAP2 family protein [Bacteroidales bacterium]|nr:phosphatase PAP2 family protein [Bacteroidales bacterium]